MSTPTPERPTLDDDLDLDRAYAQAQALAAGERGPAPAVRANVLAAAREIAAQAAARTAVPLTPVAPPVADVGRGRAGAWNLSSWRLRSGAAFCAVLLVGLAAMRFDASRKAGDNVTLAAADQAVPVQVIPARVPAPADLPPPPKMISPAPEPTLVMPSPPVEAGAPAARERAEDAAPDKAASRDPERAVAKADPPARALDHARADQPARAVDETRVADVRAAPRDSAAAFAGAAPDPHAEVARKIASLAPPALAYAPAAPVAAAPPSPRLAFAPPAPAAATPAPTALGSTARAALRSTPTPTPLHVAANADDVDTLGKLLADPATRVDAPDALGRTALQVAVAAANVRAVRLLLAAGADPDHADAGGTTPRSVARTGPNAEIAALLAAR